MLARLVLSTAMLAMALTSVQAGPINTVGEILNPGFEQFTEHPNGYLLPTHWVQSGSSNDTHPTVRVVEREKHTGRYSAQFIPQSVTGIDTGATTYIAEIWQEMSLLEVGQMLTLSYWVKFGGVPEGYDSSPTGRYNFTVLYEHDHDSVSIVPTYVTGSSTEAGNWFYHYTATWQAPDHPTHDHTYITLRFSSTDPSVYIYLDDIELSAPTILGDPQFVGLRGQSYQIHGIDGGIYNLVSSPETQVNAEFKFLSEGQCPVIDGVTANNCWSHAGSYLSKVGVQQIVDNKIHQLTIVAGPASQGFASIELDGHIVNAGTAFDDTDAFSVERVSSHRVLVKTQQFIFTFDNSDMFLNQAVASRIPLSQLRAHGLFGQTHAAKLYASALKYIAGDVDDYLVADNNLFGTDFVFNQFQI
jgi:hypothetical protein